MKDIFKDQEELTYQDIQNFLALHGQKGAKTLSLLGQLSDFRQAINDPVGQILIKDLMTKMEALLPNIVLMKASDVEKAEYRAYLNLFMDWINKINKYRNLKTKIKQGDKK